MFFYISVKIIWLLPEKPSVTPLANILFGLLFREDWSHLTVSQYF